jgi:hypothetical protein
MGRMELFYTARGRNGVICYEAFHSKDLHDHLSAKNGQPVTVEYDTFSDFGRVFGYNVHSVDGMILANGYHVLRGDFAASSGVASEGSGSAGEDDCWWKINYTNNLQNYLIIGLPYSDRYNWLATRGSAPSAADKKPIEAV